jgi:hypothetical protein
MADQELLSVPSTTSLGLSFPVKSPMTKVTFLSKEEEEESAATTTASQHHPNNDDEEQTNNPLQKKKMHLSLTVASRRLPVVSIDLRRLVGYPPSSQDVVESIQSQLVEAMWTRYKQKYGEEEEEEEDDNNNNNNNEHDTPASTESKESTLASSTSTSLSSPSSSLVVPPDFDSQIKELLDARMAHFELSPPFDNYNHQQQEGDTETAEDDDTHTHHHHFNYVKLSYPPKIRNSLASSLSSSPLSSDAWLDTAQAWSEIQSLSQVPLPPLKEPEKEYPDNTNSSSSSTHSSHSSSARPPPKDTFLFLHKLTHYLMATSRTLAWKHAMAGELRRCLQQELMAKQHQEWITTQRQVKLDNLYTVRETLVLQTELAQQHYQRLCQQRDERVSQELLIQYYQQNSQEASSSGGGGGSSMGFGMSSSAVELDLAEELQRLGITTPRHQPEGLEEEEEGFDDDDEDDYLGSSSSLGGEDSDGDDSIDYYDDSSSFSHGDRVSEVVVDAQAYDADEDGGNVTTDSLLAGNSSTGDDGSVMLPQAEAETIASNLGTRDHGPPEHGLSVPFQQRRERRQKAKRRKQKGRLEEEKQAKREALQAAAEQLRVKHTTRELILAQTKLNAFEQKVANVDELLESLQDEVWEAEEEACEEEEEEEVAKSVDPSQSSKTGDTNDHLVPSISLLDQVLAMILGALPTEPGKGKEEQYQFVRQEHEAIVAGWKAYFGRLPPPLSGQESHNNES